MVVLDERRASLVRKAAFIAAMVSSKFGSDSVSNAPRLLHVVGARPNLPKLAPVYRAAAACGLAQLIIHTVQHYDDHLSGIFFREVGIQSADVDLKVGSYTHAVQTARVMEGLEPVVQEHRPDWVNVYRDVNSTRATVRVASKRSLRVTQ